MRRFALLVFLLLCSGCSFAPRERLTFPQKSIEHTPDAEWFDVDHDGRRDFALAFDSSGTVDRLLYDDDEDGMPDRVYRLADYDDRELPHAILLLDSLPYQVMSERYAAGDFRWFKPPVKTISAFPSLTELCYSELLHAPPLPGVIDEQYDPRLGKFRGDLWGRAIDKHEQPWERRMHYHASYDEHGLSFLDPRAWYAGELARCYRAIEDSPDRATFVYTASAASMVCKFGRAGAEEVLDGARQLCLQLLYERRGAIRISMMADHGHNLTPTKNVSLAALLKRDGFHVTDSVRNDNDVVISINGLVTNAALHTRRPREVAAALVRHEAIELAMYRDGSKVIVQSASGRAAIEAKGTRTRYVPIDADVLDLAKPVEAMKTSGIADADGFADERAWFEATLDHPWPNSPPRLWTAFGRLVVSAPTVLLSIRDGYSTGKPEYEKWIDMKSTHGGLNQVNSATFVMSMTDRLKGPLLPREILPSIDPGNVPRVLR